MSRQGSVCDKCVWKSCGFVLKAFMCEYSWLTTAFGPWRLMFSAFRCFVISTKKAKSAIHTVSDISCIGLPFSTKNCPISTLSEKNRCKADPMLSHLTSLWYNTSPYSASMSCRNCWNWRWHNPFDQIKLIAFATGFMTWANGRCLAQRTCWWMMQWSFTASPPSLPTSL